MSDRLRRLYHTLAYSAVLLTLAGCGGRVSPARGLTVVGSEEHDFGECRQGEVLTHTFSLNNNTATPVEIVQLTTSCPCFTVVNARELRTNPIAPGETAALSIRFTVPGVQDTASGRVVVGYRAAGAPAEAGTQSSVTLLANVRVLPDYRISPSELDFGSVDGMSVQQVSRTLRITPAAEKVQVHQVSSPNDFLRAEIVPPSADDSGVEVRVTLDVSRFTQSRSFNGSLILATNSKRLSNALVPVRGEYTAPVEVEPSTIILDSDLDGEVNREIQLVSSHPSRIRVVSCPAAGRVSVRFDGARVARTHTPVVAVKPCPDGLLDSYLDLEVEIFIDSGKIISRMVRVLIHRFSKNGFDR